MEQRTVVITGGNAGLGYQCARHVAALGKEWAVVIACRNPEKAAAATKRLQEETGNPHVSALELDLASLESVRRFQDSFSRGNHPPLYALVCNAGLTSGTNPTYTPDGFETTFGVNHLGHYLLANLMLDQIVSNGRIIFVSSGSHQPPRIYPMATPRFEDAKALAHVEDGPEARRRMASLVRYATSKLCNILCAYEMAARLAETDKRITVNAFNPGVMADTNLAGVSSRSRALVTPLINVLGALIGRLSTADKSGKMLMELATHPKYEGLTGKYYDRGADVRSSEPSYDKAAARKLWVQSAELVGLKQSESLLSIT